MKAKEYYAMYSVRLMNPEKSDAALTDLLADFIDETTSTIERRKAKSNKAILAVIDEFNSKWNALCEMFPVPTLIRNGYREYWYLKLGLTKETANMVRRGKL